MKKKILFILLTCILIGTTSLNTMATPISSSQCPSNNPYHILVNKQNSLSSSYKPSNLVIPNVTFQTPGNIEKNYMEATAAKALEELFAAAKAQNIRLVAISGYRSYTRQATLYKNAVSTYGKTQMGTAKPGQSEHQTGLAMDVNSISQSFEYTKEGQWLAQNAHQYGFIIRYPKGKTKITGYMYEPWHIRYVGKELASYCYTNNLTLEEVERCCTQDKPLEVIIQSPSHPEGMRYHLIKREHVTYIKARDLIANVGGYVSANNQVVTLTSNQHQLLFTQDNQQVLLNTVPVILSHAPILVNQSYYVPMRSTLKLLDFNLDFIDSKTLYITNSRIFDVTI